MPTRAAGVNLFVHVSLRARVFAVHLKTLSHDDHPRDDTRETSTFPRHTRSYTAPRTTPVSGSHSQRRALGLSGARARPPTRDRACATAVPVATICVTTQITKLHPARQVSAQRGRPLRLLSHRGSRTDRVQSGCRLTRYMGTSRSSLPHAPTCTLRHHTRRSVWLHHHACAPPCWLSRSLASRACAPRLRGQHALKRS